MKNSIIRTTLITIVALTGCTQGTPGGSEATGINPVFGQANNSFNLVAPEMTSALQQGKKTEARVGIQRAYNFGEDVAIKFSDIPEGITIEPSTVMIKHGDTDAKIRFVVGNNAPLGEYQIKLAGHPSKGADAQLEFKLTIATRDTFRLSMPYLSTSLQQGGSTTFSVHIKREKSFDQDVALQFGELPLGVTLNPGTPVIKNGDTETLVTLAGADDARLGTFNIRVTGHPGQGANASSEFNLIVAKK